MILMFGLATCGGGGGEPSEPTPLALQVVAIPASPVPSGGVISPPVRVRLLGVGNSPVAVAGVAVTVALGSPNQALGGTLTVETDENGVASFTDLVVTGAAGICRFSFSSEGLPDLLTNYFQLVGGAPTTILRAANDSQTAGVHLAELPQVPRAVVRDLSGNPVAGVAVSIVASEGGGTVTPPAGGYVTGANGEVSLSGWRLGPLPGMNRLSVTVAGHPEIPAAVFTAFGVVGPPAGITLTPAAFTPVVYTLVAAPVTATVRDARGNALPGIGVIFHAGGNPGSALYGDTVETDGAGQATLGGWRPGTLSGSYALTATAPGVSSAPAEFTVQAGAPTRVLATGPTPRAPVGLPGTVRFQVLDLYGNAKPGAQVGFEVTAGTGTMAPPVALSGADGVVESEVTPAARGALSVTARLVDRPDSLATRPVTVIAPAAILVVAGDSQHAHAGFPLPAPVRIRVVDDSGRGLAEVPVRGFESHYLTDSVGELESSLQPGGVLGPVRYHWTTPWLPGDTAWATVLVGPGYASNLTVVRNGSAAEVNTPVDTLPVVSARDQYGNIPVGELVAWGNGDTTQVDSLGFAHPGEWVLGTTAGLQAMTVSGVQSGSQWLVTAVALPGAAHLLSFEVGGTTGGFEGEAPAVTPVLTGADKYGNSTANRPLSMAITGGTGTLTGAPTAFDSTGKVRVTGWTLGAGRNELTITADGRTKVLAIDAAPPTPFHITLLGTPAAYLPYFQEAVFRWRRVFTAELPDVPVNLPADACGWDAFSGSVDDLAIRVYITAIDGPGQILGGAGPCVIRAGGLPAYGLMIFDEADVGGLVANGRLEDVLLHEMGHVLGIGSLWADMGLSVPSDPDPYYKGIYGRAQFTALGGSVYSGNEVPIEDTGGPGTAYVHWREGVMPSELMTGYLSAAVNPMSAVTVGSLKDLGYAVDLEQADAYTMFTAPAPVPGAPPIRILDIVGAPKFSIDADGVLRRIQ